MSVRPVKETVPAAKLAATLARIRKDGGVIVEAIHRDRGRRCTIKHFPKEIVDQGEVMQAPRKRRPQRKFRRHR